MVDSMSVPELRLLAAKSRQNVIRMLRASRHGHLGGALSCIDIVTALYFKVMNIDPNNPKMPDRDRFVLSAGHKCLAQYAVLAERGFFSKDILDTSGELNSKIPGHPDMYKLAGIEANTGALGHGLSIACGMALGLRMNNKPSRVFVITGDGELPEGSNWEAASVASHFKLDNLVVFVDKNDLQISGRCVDIMNMTPIDERFRAFGWSVKNIDGNNMEEIVAVLDSVPFEQDKPSLIVAHTTKSKGLSFGEGVLSYHYWNPTDEELVLAESEMQSNIDMIEAELSARVRR